MRTVALLLITGFLAGCAGPAGAGGATPKESLRAYAAALREGRARDAYALLSDDARKSLPFEAFRRMIVENPEEVAEISRALARPTSAPVVTAKVRAPSGETLHLVMEDGRWKITSAAIDLYGQDTPKNAVVSFLRAYDHQRWDVLLRFVPEAQAAGLTAKKLRAAWTGDQKAEMDRVTQALAASLSTARVEVLGDRATMAYGAGGTVELLLEEGAWKIEDFR